MTPSEWLPWMLELMGSWMPLRKEDGCMAIHLGSAVYYRGMPAISSYRERFVVAAPDELGLYRMPDLYWEQPARLPNLDWGAVSGHHPRPTIAPIYFFSRSAFPYMAADDMREIRPHPPPPTAFLMSSTKRPPR